MKDKNVNDFLRFAHSNTRASASIAESYIKKTSSEYLMPYIMEERELRVTPMDVFSRMMVERVIFLGTAIDSDVANIIQAQLLYLESTDQKKPIQLYLNTPGGGVYAGLGIYDTMRFIEPKVTTTCTGLAASMGAILLAAGAKGERSALPHSRIMIHQPSGGSEGQESDIEIAAKEIKLLKSELYDILAEHTGQLRKKVEKDADRDYWMRSFEAQQYGLIDNILTYKVK